MIFIQRHNVMKKDFFQSFLENSNGSLHHSKKFSILQHIYKRIIFLLPIISFTFIIGIIIYLFIYNISNIKKKSSFLSLTLNKTKCITNSGGTCYLTNCYNWRGPTDCIDRACICKPGYCVRDGICVGPCFARIASVSPSFSIFPGCTKIQITLVDIPQQIHKAGNYSAISTLFFADRPVWKQIDGSNWIWYCSTDESDCWIVSDLAPNNKYCKAGLLSAKNEMSTDPYTFYKELQPWKYWNHQEWLIDIQQTKIKVSCLDSSIDTGNS